MAKRVLNRRQLRDEADEAARAAPTSPKGETPAEGPPAAAKAKAAKEPRKPRPKKVKEPERLRASWGVFDNSMKRVALFSYNRRAEADRKVADLNVKKAGQFFLQLVKEPMVAPPAL
jgi:hypothetical protein